MELVTVDCSSSHFALIPDNAAHASEKEEWPVDQVELETSVAEAASAIVPQVRRRLLQEWTLSSLRLGKRLVENLGREAAGQEC